MSAISDHDFNSLHHQVCGLDLGQLLGGLAILVKDTSDYINANGMVDEAAEAFRRAYLETINRDRYYWDEFGPELHQSLRAAKLEDGYAASFSSCNFELRDLLTLDEEEWMRAAGWFFFNFYTSGIKAEILSNTTLKKLRDAFYEWDAHQRKCTEHDHESQQALEDPQSQEAEASDEGSPPDRHHPRKPLQNPYRALTEKLAHMSSYPPCFWYPLMLYLVVLLSRTDFKTLE